MTWTIALLGIVAGILTTLSGQGGGLLLLLSLSALYGPHAGLAWSSPALLLGNMHRAWMIRSEIDWKMVVAVGIGAFPGALAGGFFAGRSPAWLLKIFLVGATALAIAKALGWLKWTLPRQALGLGGFLVGFMTGTSGGAGILLAPLLLAAGLTGLRFIGTIACLAVVMHVGRVFAYQRSGLIVGADVPKFAILAAAIFVGNAIGDRIRRRLGERVTERIEWGTLVVCTVIALLGFAK